MFLKSLLIILIAAFNCATLSSTQKKSLPKVRFLKAEKGKYGDDVVYYFQLFKNNADTSLYFSSTGSSDGITYGLGYFETKIKGRKTTQVRVTTHANLVQISSLPDSTILEVESSNEKKPWKLGLRVWKSTIPNSQMMIYSDEIKPIKFRKTKKK